jgi:hypothetical protein
MKQEANLVLKCNLPFSSCRWMGESPRCLKCIRKPIEKTPHTMAEILGEAYYGGGGIGPLKADKRHF